MSDFRIVRARLITERALAACRGGATCDQLNDYLEELQAVLVLDEADEPTLKSRDLDKHIQTLERRLDWIESRSGGSYDEREASALRVAIETMRLLAHPKEVEEPETP